MPIDTLVSGNPDSVRASASWLRDRFGAVVATTADSMFTVRNNADAGWDGSTSDAFRDKMTGGAEKTLEMATAARDYGQRLDEFASALQQSLDQMDAVRSVAAHAGLTVAGFDILDPEDRTEAMDGAYRTASQSAESARETERAAGEALKDGWAGLTETLLFVIGDLMGSAGETYATAKVSLLTKQAKFFADDAAKFLDLARNAPAGTPASQIYRDFDQSRVLARGSAELIDAAEDLESKASKVAVRAGAALAGIGIAYDIYTGKPADQAIVSGTLGFGASVAAGALLGSCIPAPILGTAVGALGGAAVGIFTSGAADTLYTEGITSMGDAIGDGAIAVKEAGVAIGGLATGAWDAIF